MTVKLTKRGNSLTVPIPADIALSAGLTAGSSVEITTDGDRLIITPAGRPPRRTLQDLLTNCTPQAMHKTVDWGPDRGREILD